MPKPPWTGSTCCAPASRPAARRPGVVTAYKNLKYVERDFRHIKADDLDLRPVYHHLEERVKAHVLICMLACYLTWHLRRAWAPLTFTDENPPSGGDPVAPARRSTAAQAKASRQHDQAAAYRSLRGLLAHLATLTRNQVRFAGATATVPMLAEPTSEQREAFQLIGAPIPLTLRSQNNTPTSQKTAGQHQNRTKRIKRSGPLKGWIPVLSTYLSLHCSTGGAAAPCRWPTFGCARSAGHISGAGTGRPGRRRPRSVSSTRRCLGRPG